MSARDLGWMLLPVLSRWHQSDGFVPTEIIRTLADQYAPRNVGAENLLLEGMGYLERIGYLTNGITRSGPWRMLMVTRAGEPQRGHLIAPASDGLRDPVEREPWLSAEIVRRYFAIQNSREPLAALA